MKRVGVRCKRPFEFSERLMVVKLGDARHVCPDCSMAACNVVLEGRVAK